jgi:CDP-glucose 4,6-dehydratase
VARVVEQLHRLWRARHAWSAAPGEHPHEAHYLKLDSSRARALLGWRPRLALPAALEWVVEWHRGHRDDSDLAALTREQIDRYVALLAGDGLAGDGLAGDGLAGDPGASGATDAAD